MNVISTHLPIEGLLNARHLGGYACAGGETAASAYIRCEHPGKLSPAGADFLWDYGIRDVIDLRSPEEAQRSPNPLAQDGRFGYHLLPVFGTAASPAALMGESVDMGQLYLSMLDGCRESFRRIFDAILASEGGVLYHCTAGKDRTGVLTALLLLSCGVSEKDVARDYCYTEALLRPLTEQLMGSVPAGVPASYAEAMLAAKPAYIEAALAHLRGAYSGARGYLTGLGFTDVQIGRLCARLCPSEKE